jgi:hypothetical protein
VGTFVGAYWDVRAESAEHCAGRIAALLTRMAAIDPVLAGWRDKAATKKEAAAQPVVTSDRNDLVQRLLRSTTRYGITLPEAAGYSVFWWNGRAQKDSGATLTVNNACSTDPSLPRSVVITLPDPSQLPELYANETASSLIRTIIETFEPQRAVWLDDASRDAQTEPDQIQPDGSVVLGKLVGHPAGWATYLRNGAATGFNTLRLATGSRVERVSDGTLVTVSGDAKRPDVRDVLAVRTAMGYSIPELEDAAPQRPGAPEPVVGTNASGVPVAGPQKRETPSDGEEKAQPPSTELPRPGEG